MKSILKHFLRRAGLVKSLKLPEFLVLGTQKGGTTSLHHLLKKHPGIFLPDVKEVHYFSQNYSKSLEWYSDHYAKASTDQLKGDITPFYLYHISAPARINSTLPNAKLIVLLRDPVERTLSQYFHAKRNGYETLDLLSALRIEEKRLYGVEELVLEQGVNHYSYQKHSYISRSRYECQLNRYREYFRDNQLLVLKSEDFFSSMNKAWESITDFLQVEKLPFPGKPVHANKGKDEKYFVDEYSHNYIRAKLEGTYDWIKSKYGITW